MRIEPYQLILAESSTYFEFLSVGVNGVIRKMVEFQPIDDLGYYNLAFGDKNPVTGKMNDSAVTNNGDMEKVLAIVVSCLYTFFDAHPTALVYATGSTVSRTRLYRMGITKFYEEVKKDFILLGRNRDTVSLFELGKDYNAFLALRKFD